MASKSKPLFDKSLHSSEYAETLPQPNKYNLVPKVGETFTHAERKSWLQQFNKPNTEGKILFYNRKDHIKNGRNKNASYGSITFKSQSVDYVDVPKQIDLQIANENTSKRTWVLTAVRTS
tara:strand:- start:117 stop:476 length:360 start_codon:yes stop_codon:yes gene_type:complete